jgi:HlyD family secretion protein
MRQTNEIDSLLITETDVEPARTLGLGQTVRPVLWRRPYFLAGCFLLALAGSWSVWQRLGHSRNPRFQTAQVKRGDLTVVVTATGTLQPLNSVEVGSEISGLIQNVKADFNARVKQGDILAEIDTRQLRAQVQRSQAALEVAEAGLKQAEASLLEARQNGHRAEQLAASKLIPEQDLDAARATLARAEATLASAKAQVTVSRASLDADQTNLEKAVIRSPIDGIVLARKVEPGQTVAAAFQTPVLFKMAENLDRMKLIVNVDEADVGGVKQGQSANFRVDAYPERQFSAEVTSLRNDPQTVQGVVSYEAVLIVNNSEGLLRPGMTATATIRTETRTNVLLIANAAIRFVPPGATPPAPTEGELSGRETPASYAWSLHGSKPTALRVAKGLSDGRSTEVLSGEVQAGTEVLVDLLAHDQ